MKSGSWLFETMDIRLDDLEIWEIYRFEWNQYGVAIPETILLFGRALRHIASVS